MFYMRLGKDSCLCDLHMFSGKRGDRISEASSF